MNDSKSILEQSKRKLEDILTILRKSKELSSRPTCVMAINSLFKDVWIKQDNYLNHCLIGLQSISSLLVFGCSFHNNKHIVKTLQDCSNIKELWVCYKDVAHQTVLKESFSDISDKKINWIDSSKIQEIIW